MVDTLVDDIVIDAVVVVVAVVAAAAVATDIDNVANVVAAGASGLAASAALSVILRGCVRRSRVSAPDLTQMLLGLSCRLWMGGAGTKT